MHLSGRSIVALIALLAGARSLRAQCPDGTPPPCTRAAPRATAPSGNSVAVLAFENLSRDTGDAYIAEGLTEEITARLGQVNRLAVTSRTSVRRLRNAADLQTPELGRALNAVYLLNGSVRHAGERLRVTVELVRATSGARVWGDQFDRNTGDLLTIEEDIARAVATDIAGQLLPAERVTLAARPTQSTEAYDHYLRGLRALRSFSPATLGTAVQENEAALRLDSAFASARGNLSLAYALSLNWGYALPGIAFQQLLPLAMRESGRALRDSPNSAQAWLARGVLLIFLRPRTFDGAEEAIRHALSLDPDNAQIYQWLALLRRRLGDFEHSRQYYARCSDLDPSQVICVADRGFLAYQLRQYEEARRWYDSALVIDTVAWQNFLFAARASWGAGDSAGALRQARLGAVRSGGQLIALATLAQLEGLTGAVGAGHAMIDTIATRLEALDSVSVRDGYEAALALIGTGQNERALALLAKTRPVGAWLWTYLVFPGFDPVRNDPRFQRIFAEARPPNAPTLP
ncbi:MAG TPA: hypothetical protein VGI92_01840 [Gemmatimonadales bacterium]